MRILRNMRLHCKYRLIALLALAGVVTACSTKEVAHCFYGIWVRVVVESSENQTSPDWMGEGVIGNVILYVFDANEILIDKITTQVGKTEKLYYPQTSRLHLVATANVDEQVDMTDMAIGSISLTDAEIRLKEATQYLSYTCYNHPGDIFSGKIGGIDNTKSGGVIDLPVKRRIAAVTVRVKRLKEHVHAPQAVGEDFTVALGSRNYSLNLEGEVGTVGNGSNYPVAYKLAGEFRTMFDKDYLETPAQVTPGKTDYVRVLSTDEGSLAEISIFHNDVLVTGTPVTTDKDGNPIVIKNDVLNVIQIEFTQTGSVSVTIKQAGWNGYVEIEKDFEDS